MLAVTMTGLQLTEDQATLGFYLLIDGVLITLTALGLRWSVSWVRARIPDDWARMNAGQPYDHAIVQRAWFRWQPVIRLLAPVLLGALVIAFLWGPP